jgi:hypothetical protein
MSGATAKHGQGRNPKAYLNSARSSAAAGPDPRNGSKNAVAPMWVSIRAGLPRPLGAHTRVQVEDYGAVFCPSSGLPRLRHFVSNAETAGVSKSVAPIRNG